jgi:alanyl-tRNA synthetase
LGPDATSVEGPSTPETDESRYLEIWNLVFMQFERDENGEMNPLPNPSIDTGAGLERVAAVLQGVTSNYDTDLFQPILRATAELAGSEYRADEEADVSFRVIADHLRAVAFLLADGVIPSNEGRGYVLRRILRRAVRHGMILGFEAPFLHRLLPTVQTTMGSVYPELEKAERASVATTLAEEEKFFSTIAAASRQVQEAIDRVRHDGRSELPGESVFRLYDTYGLPLELIREIAEEEQFQLDETGFETALDKQRQRSRQAGGEAQQELVAVREALRDEQWGASEFVGYRDIDLEGARVAGLAKSAGGRYEIADRLESGEHGVVVLDRTPFYAESGGQVGDRGRLVWAGGGAVVLDTQSEPSGVRLHFVDVQDGVLRRGSEVTAHVDAVRRRPTQRNHTATHLLHLALRHVLGEGVRQAGSLVAPDRLRFDFTFHRPLTPEELRRVEDLVNGWILQAQPTAITEDREFAEAVEAGAMALFGEKYGDSVRTVEVAHLRLGGAEGEQLTSLELCGGCHVDNTGEIGLLLITAERGVASGVRRIEAVTGEGTQRLVRHQRDVLDQVAGSLGVESERAPAEIDAWRRKTRALEKELADLRMRLVSGAESSGELQIEGIKIIAREVPPAPVNEIRNMADVLRQKMGSGVVVLASREGGKVLIVSSVTADLTDRVHAGRLASAVASVVGGAGGGRPDFAQAGGKEPAKLPAALERVGEFVRQQIDSA